MSTASSAPATSALSRAAGSEPTRMEPSRWLRIFAWCSFVLNALIIGTGGAVRLTGSGLGCSEWPLCTPGSLVPTPELGVHGLIEFGNRTISGPLLLAAILVLVLSWRIRSTRKDLFVLAWIVLGLVLVQAVIGGVVVWEDLQAVLVGFHYTVSLIIVCVTAAYLARMYEPSGPRAAAAPRGFAVLTHVTTLVMAVVIFIGVLTTGSGPHSGDADVVRDGFDATWLSHVHAWPGYLLVLLTVVLLEWARRDKLRPANWLTALLVMQAVQVAVGIYQARNGLPPLAVGVHMVLASLTAATLTVAVLRLKKPVDSAESAEGSRG